VPKDNFVESPREENNYDCLYSRYQEYIELGSVDTRCQTLYWHKII